MNKKTAANAITTSMIEEQTALFLKSGGAIEYVNKGKSGQVLPSAAKPANAKSSR